MTDFHRFRLHFDYSLNSDYSDSAKLPPLTAWYTGTPEVFFPILVETATGGVTVVESSSVPMTSVSQLVLANLDASAAVTATFSTAAGATTVVLPAAAAAGEIGSPLVCPDYSPGGTDLVLTAASGSPRVVGYIAGTYDP